jgi:CheY-like chemotaxis protein
MKASILCVDDEPVNLTIMEELLQDNYELSTVKSGTSCLQQVSLHKPDLILLDVNMPDVDGLQTCARLRADPATADIPIIFVSALASQAELMAGYEAGGDDYITKPFSEDILQKKVEIVLASQQQKRDLKNISERAVEALRRTLTRSEELGMVVRFLHQCQTARSLEELARHVFECLREFELDSSLLILAEPESRIWFSDRIVRPMETQILESLRNQDRVLSFGSRIAINSDFASLLVRNLPSGDEEIARLRELLAIMIEGLDARLQVMQSEMLLDQRRDVLGRVLKATRENLTRIDEHHQQQKTVACDVMALLEVELGKSLGRLKLGKQQEAVLTQIIDSAAQKIKSVYDDGLQLDERFEEMINELLTALTKQD